MSAEGLTVVVSADQLVPAVGELQLEVPWPAVVTVITAAAGAPVWCTELSAVE